ncbi:MAG: hypothetical protein WEE89_00590 [Gemmatimonadota bacterium]
MDFRIARAQRLLRENGVEADPTVAGHADDILSLRASFTELDRLREMAPELKSLGFRYVTLELDTEAASES